MPQYLSTDPNEGRPTQGPYLSTDPSAGSFGTRADGSPKGKGFLGALQRPDGSVSSEISIGVNIDGKEVEIPTLVPTLSKSERDWLINNDISDPSKLPKSIVNKATTFARARMLAGKSPFADDNEAPPEPTPPKQPGLATIGEQIGGKLGVGADVVAGALKGAGNTVFGLGKIVHDYTPIGRISDAIQPGAFDQPLPELEARNTAQKIGKGAEQIGEFLIPSSAVSKLGKAGEVARAVAQTMSQGGTPVESGVSGALTAVLPGASAAAKASGALRESAEKTMAQALGATKEKFKAEAAKLAPQMLERGIGGSRKAMLELAKDTSKSVGTALDDAYKTAAASGATISGPTISGALQLTKDALQVKNAAGKLVPIPGSERVIKRLGALDDFVQSLGSDIPVDKAAQVKRTMDKIVDKAGLFGAKATASATDNADAWALREAAGSFRELLNRNPTIADLNKEAAFWTGLKNVLKETEKRTQSQRGGITDAIRSAAGATIGATAAGPIGGAVGAVAMQALSKAWNSPAFKTMVAGPAKSAFADALASGSASRILGAVNKIAAAIPAEVQ